MSLQTYLSIRAMKDFLEKRVRALEGNPNAQLILDVYRSSIAHYNGLLDGKYEMPKRQIRRGNLRLIK